MGWDGMVMRIATGVTRVTGMGMGMGMGDELGEGETNLI